jgi:Flp pilus assembly protein TadG
MTPSIRPFFQRFRRDERGVVFVIAAISMLLLVGIGAIVVDLGNFYHAKHSLQASADAAALAGAMRISSNSSTQAVAAANQYSAGTGGMNAMPNLSVTATPQTINCTGATGATCTPDVASPNAMKVTQTAAVPTFFGRIFGVSSVSVSASAFALAAGGQGQQTDIMLVLDTTQSMNNTDSSCGATRLSCALSGFRTMLQGFNPAVQQVGLIMFPGLNSAASAAQEYDCSSSTPASTAIKAYNASPVYSIVPFSNDYNSNGTLNTNSNLVKAARGGASGCTAGITAYGGVGTFYADAITTAQNYLTTSGRSNVRKMIILLSDGDANSSSAPNPHQECHQAITAATAANSSGTIVVTIGYGSPNSGSCSTDTAPTIQACQTLMQMATIGTGSSGAPQWFYSDSASGCHGGNSASNLSAIFQSVGSQIATNGPRLIAAS